MSHARIGAFTKRLIGAGILVLTLTGTAAAQDPLGRPAPRDTTHMGDVFEEMQTQLQRLLPVMLELARSMEDAMPVMEGNGGEGPDVASVARRAARLTRAYYDALLDEGFTREEALRIVSGALPRARP